MKPPTIPPLVAALLALSGCAIGLADHESTGRDTTGDGSGRGGVDDPLPTAESCEATWLTRVEGDVRDLAGRNVSGAFVQFCVRTADDTLHCLAPSESDASGVFVQELGEESRCVDRLAIRVLVPEGPYATTYCPVGIEGAQGALSLAEPLVLVPLEHGGVPPMGDETASRWVNLPGGIALEVRPDALWGDYEGLAATELDPAAGRCFLSPGDGVLGLWALGPEVDIGDEGFVVRIPERTGLGEGTTVELLLLGGLATLLADGTEVEEADFVPFGTGTVAGGFVVSDPGSELPYLSWLGYRVKR